MPELSFSEFVGRLGDYMTYECGCYCKKADGYKPCLGALSGKYLTPDAFVVPTKRPNPKKQQQRPQEKPKPLSPYQKWDLLLSKWYDEYCHDGFFNVNKSYVWFNKDCQQCVDRDRIQAFKPVLEILRIKHREGLELAALRKEEQDRLDKKRQEELALLRAAKRTQEETDELEDVTDDDADYDWAQKDEYTE